MQAPRVEKYLQYRIYTDVTEGGLGLTSHLGPVYAPLSS